MGDNYRLLDDPGPQYPDDPASVAPGLQGADPSLLANPTPAIPAGLQLAPSNAATYGSGLPSLGLNDLSEAFHPLPPLRQSLKQEALTVGLPALVGALGSLFTHSTAPLTGALAGAAAGNQDYLRQEALRQQTEALRRERLAARLQAQRAQDMELLKTRSSVLQEMYKNAASTGDPAAFMRLPANQRLLASFGFQPGETDWNGIQADPGKLQDEAQKIYKGALAGMEAQVGPEKWAAMDPAQKAEIIGKSTAWFQGKSRPLAEIGQYGGTPSMDGIRTIEPGPKDATSAAGILYQLKDEWRQAHNGQDPVGQDLDGLVTKALQTHTSASIDPQTRELNRQRAMAAAATIQYLSGQRTAKGEAAARGVPQDINVARMVKGIQAEYDAQSEQFQRRAAAYSDMTTALQRPQSAPDQQAFLEAALHVIDPTKANVTRANVEEIKGATDPGDRLQNILYQAVHRTVNLNTLDEVRTLANNMFEEAKRQQQYVVDTHGRSIAAMGANPFVYITPKGGPDVPFSFADQDKWPTAWTDPFLHPERIAGSNAPQTPSTGTLPPPPGTGSGAGRLPTAAELPAKSAAAPNQPLPIGKRVKMSDGSIRIYKGLDKNGEPIFSR